MLDIRLDIPLKLYDENDFECNFELICNWLANKSFSCRLVDALITFSASVSHRKKTTERNARSVLLKAYKKYMDLHPENEEIRKKLVEKENEKSTSWEIIITLTGQVDAEVNIENNFYITASMERPSIEEIVEKDLCIPLLFKRVDEHLIPAIHQITTNFMISLLLSDAIVASFLTGKYVLYLDGTQFEDCRLIEFDDDMICSSVVPDSKVDIEDCWKWICNNTMMGIPGKKEPVYFTILSYLFNRYDYEALLYSVIGLESLFTEPESKNISYQLKKNIAAVFPSLQEADLKKVYKLRSKFVHAGSDISFLDSFIGFANDSTLKESLELASAILIESIRLLIRNQASRFVFKETTSYSLC